MVFGCPGQFLMDLLLKPCGFDDFTIRKPGIDPFLYLMYPGNSEGEFDTAVGQHCSLL